MCSGWRFPAIRGDRYNSDMGQSTKPHRRRFRFSLRMLLLAVAVCGAAFGWLGAIVRHTVEQERAVRAIERLRCVICFESKTPRWLQKLLGIDPFAKVTSVLTYGENFSDAAFTNLQGFVHVRLLTLGDANISDEGLRRLRDFKELQYLGLERTPISDAGLAHLEGLTRLQRLQLTDTQITDAGLAHLRGLRQLGELNLAGTKVTDAGCQELQAAIPDLRIVR